MKCNIYLLYTEIHQLTRGDKSYWLLNFIQPLGGEITFGGNIPHHLFNSSTDGVKRRNEKQVWIIILRTQ